MSIKVKGLAEAIKAIEKKGEDAIQATKDILSDVATDIEISAIALAPDFVEGEPFNIDQRLDKIVENQGLLWKVGTQGTNLLDVYVEFGTGLSAREILGRPDYTPEIRALAWTFKKPKDGRLVGTPYLFPSFFKYTANIVQRIKDEIAKSVK